MDIELFNNKVLIIKDGLKKYILDLLKDRLINVKIITLSELKKKYYFDYDKEAIYYICNKYNVVSEIAKMYLNNLYYVKDVDILKSIVKNDYFEEFFFANSQDDVIAQYLKEFIDGLDS